MLIISFLCLLFFMGNTFVLTQGCDSGWFGDKCQYQCHCVSKCNTSGDCTDNKCSPGWFGYKCQYRDLVHLSTRRINKTIANNKNKTCIELKHKDNITLQWDNLYVFTWLRIDFNNEIPELITDLQILLRQETNISSSYVPCQNRLFYIVKPQTIDVKCDFNGTFKELVLKGKTIQSICTLNINGGKQYYIFKKLFSKRDYAFICC
uniref:EGF-like domain-containing protein n=1 Tax=Biomphalaria glabrata TaxID=6526 RepID=A0A2C9KYD7_BIOGL